MLEIREFIEADWKRLREIYLASKKLGFPFLNGAVFQPEDFERDTDGRVILVTELKGEIVGFASYWAPENFMHNLYLDPAYTGIDIGKSCSSGQ